MAKKSASRKTETSRDSSQDYSNGNLGTRRGDYNYAERLVRANNGQGYYLGNKNQFADGRSDFQDIDSYGGRGKSNPKLVNEWRYLVNSLPDNPKKYTGAFSRQFTNEFSNSLSVLNNAVRQFANMGYTNDAVTAFQKYFDLKHSNPDRTKMSGKLLAEYETSLANIYGAVGDFGGSKEHLLKALGALGEAVPEHYTTRSTESRNSFNNSLRRGHKLSSDSMSIVNLLYGNGDSDRGVEGRVNGDAEILSSVRNPQDKDYSPWTKGYSKGGALKQKIVSTHRVLSDVNRKGEVSFRDAHPYGVSKRLADYYEVDNKIRGDKPLEKTSSKKFATLGVVGLGGATFALVGSQMTGNVIGYSDGVSWLGVGTLILAIMGFAGLGLYMKNRKKSNVRN